VTDKRCLITDVSLTPENNALAHIIPNSLGGSLKYLDLISTDANQLLNKKFDVPLYRAYRNIMTGADGKRDRGENQPAEVYDSDNVKWLLSLGKALRRAKSVVIDANGIDISQPSRAAARESLAEQLTGLTRLIHDVGGYGLADVA
jgi:hypothetical protein